MVSFLKHAATAPVRPFESTAPYADTDPASSALRNVITWLSEEVARRLGRQDWNWE